VVGVRNELSDTTGRELAEALGTVDAMITTPSTCMLEGMLQGVPVALLDYHNCPHYVPAAWAITAREHLDQVVPELLDPSPGRMLYQDTVLHDALECRTPAMPRMAQLVEAMVRVGRECREAGRMPAFPARMLADPQGGHHLPEERFDLRALYPDQEVFRSMDRAALQAEIGHLRAQRLLDDAELALLKRRLGSRNPMTWLGRALRSVLPGRLRQALSGLRRRRNDRGLVSWAPPVRSPGPPDSGRAEGGVTRR
jgi:hypothetical protein